MCKTSGRLNSWSHPHFDHLIRYSIKACVVLVISYVVFLLFSSYPSGVTEAIILAELYHEVIYYVPTYCS